MIQPEKFMVFNVESVGLHGEGFAVGYVVVDREGVEFDSGTFNCDASFATGRGAGREWIEKHVVPSLRDPDVIASRGNGLGSTCPRAVRQRFWTAWQYWKAQGAVLAADCPWPVEARFLSACVDDDTIDREWHGPYPLIDIASVRLARGLDPLGTCERCENELPIHHPLADARQSARLLLEALPTETRP